MYCEISNFSLRNIMFITLDETAVRLSSHVFHLFTIFVFILICLCLFIHDEIRCSQNRFRIHIADSVIVIVFAFIAI